MKCRYKKGILLIHFVILFVLSIPINTACEPRVPIVVENKTDQIVTIFVNDIREFDVAPSQIVKKRTVPAIYTYYQIKAKNSKGETIYSRKFSFDELNYADWKVVIPTLQEGLESSDNITAK